MVDKYYETCKMFYCETMDGIARGVTPDREGGENMRIEAYNAVSQIYSAKKTGKVNNVASAYGRDQVQISSIGKDIQTAKAAVANSSDIRSEITEPIKAAIANGTYNVSNDDFASKLLAKYEEKLGF